MCYARLGVDCCWLGPDMDMVAREKLRRQVHVKFNNWELEDEGGAWLEMEPAGVPHEGGADWW